MAFLCTTVFYSTYYSGLLFSVYMTPLAIGFGLLTGLLLISKSFAAWAEKVGIYAGIVIILAVVFQNIDMHLIMAKLFSITDTDSIKWGERQMLCNCIWLLSSFLSSVSALIVTAVLVYKEEQKMVG